MEHQNKPDEPSVVRKTLDVKAITTFQLLPENGGFNLILGSRNLITGESRFPAQETEIFACGFLSHVMLKDLYRVLGTVISDFEHLYGPISLPGIDPPRNETSGSET